MANKEEANQTRIIDIGLMLDDDSEDVVLINVRKKNKETEVLRLQPFSINQSREFLNEYQAFPTILQNKLGRDFKGLNFFSQGDTMKVFGVLTSEEITNKVIELVSKHLEKPTTYWEENGITYNEVLNIFKVMVEMNEWQKLFPFLFPENQLDSLTGIVENLGSIKSAVDKNKEQKKAKGK